ncbi:PREDICTED: bolA-like protein 2 isoform X1 [Pseudopodoces humilis]|uniref:bolA-like protein 2 isoform X1 n=2 Tax=Pseudopodoces humilis TaxID=181119 RepID=UPI0006B83046|nr:PREDICTED: bolA-like protein 2 isoform X1 [Pseudopodoces humilis]
MPRFSFRLGTQNAPRAAEVTHAEAGMEPPTAEELRERLQERLQAEHVEVQENPQLCRGSFRLVVVSGIFRGLKTLQRHRLVNEALKEELGRIHALEQRTLTPEQWEEQRGSLA